MSEPELFVVATPIGNPDDLTLRAIDVLKGCDWIICEEFKPARRLLSRLDIQKPLEQLNEHNSRNQTPVLFARIVEEKAKVCLISDGGTPVFADPGQQLVQLCRQNNVTVTPVPGANSLMAALMAAGVDVKRFFYGGFPPRKTSERQQFFRSMLSLPVNTWVFLDTPYRLTALMKDVQSIFGDTFQCTICYKLTMLEERFYKGTASDLLKNVVPELPKGEFVLLIQRQKKHKQGRSSRGKG